MAIKVKQYSNVKTMKKSLKRSASGGSFLIGIQEDGMVVRFLTEPEEWLEYQEFFNEGTNRSEIVTEDWVKPAGSTRNPSKRFGACVLNRENGEVVGLRMSSTLVQSLIAFYEKYGTIMDRDYELIREGKGLDTTYSALPESPERIRGLEKYEVLDIMAILESMASQGDESDEDDDDDDEDEDDAPTRNRKPARGKKNRRAELYDEDDEEEEEDDEPPFGRSAPRKKSTMRARKSRRGL